MTHTVEFFKELNKLNSFDMKLNEVGKRNFRVMTNDHVFPEFELNQYFGLHAMMSKISNKNFNEKRIVNYLNSLKDNEPRLYDNSMSGLVFFGIFKDNNNELYSCVSSQLDQTDLIKFYNYRALDETISNLEVRYNLLQKINDPSVSPETYLTVQQEYDDLRQCKLSYLYANRYDYLKSLNDELKLILENNLYLLNNICKACKMDLSGGVSVLNHVTIKEDFIYYFVSELQNSSLIFYNLQEGFGTIANNNDTAFLIPTASFSDKEITNDLNIKDVSVYESSILSRQNYNTERFLTRDKILSNITDYVKSINLSESDVVETNHYSPVFLYLM